MWQLVIGVLEFFTAKVLKICRVLKTKKTYLFVAEVVKCYLISLNLVA